MYMIVIDEKTCSGCGSCIEACPNTLLGMNSESKAEVTGDPSECLGCESCSSVCTTGSLTVREI